MLPTENIKDQSYRNDWKNYWATRSGLIGLICAGWRVLRAVVNRYFWKWLAEDILSKYCSDEILHPISVPFEVSKPSQRFQYKSSLTGRPSVGLVRWARRYERMYRSFFSGGYHASVDAEEYWTLHQFGWAFALLLSNEKEMPNTVIKQYVEVWIDRLGNEKSDASWRSFSISERLCNWNYILNLVEFEDLWPKVAECMEKQAKHLSCHLESIRKTSINNHLLNNGRSLYLTGSLLKQSAITNLGRMILIEEVGRQFSSDGFLDEGSSHYHLIFTRAYLDAIRVAILSEDSEFEMLIAPRVQEMLRACGFFFDNEAPQEWQVPFFGDISPDPPPGFFNSSMRFWQMAKEVSIDSEKVALATDFTKPWYAEKDRDSFLRNRGWVCFPDSGYYSWIGEKYRLWWHARKTHPFRFHSHNDWGSFQLHLKGEPLFIDPGRESYSLEVGVYDSRLTLAQNGVMVDGYEQVLFRRRELFDPQYFRDQSEVIWSGDETEGNLVLQLSVYERLKNPVSFTRTFNLLSDRFTIEDSLSGNGRHCAIVAFHLHPDVQCVRCKRGGFILRTPKGIKVRFIPSPGGVVRIKRGGEPVLPGGYCSTSYGEKQETTSIFAYYENIFSVVLRHKILI